MDRDQRIVDQVKKLKKRGFHFKQSETIYKIKIPIFEILTTVVVLLSVKRVKKLKLT